MALRIYNGNGNDDENVDYEKVVDKILPMNFLIVEEMTLQLIPIKDRRATLQYLPLTPAKDSTKETHSKTTNNNNNAPPPISKATVSKVLSKDTKTTQEKKKRTKEKKLQFKWEKEEDFDDILNVDDVKYTVHVWYNHKWIKAEIPHVIKIHPLQFLKNTVCRQFQLSNWHNFVLYRTSENEKTDLNEERSLKNEVRVESWQSEYLVDGACYVLRNKNKTKEPKQLLPIRLSYINYQDTR